MLKTGLVIISLIMLAGCVAEVGPAGYSGGGYYPPPRTYGYGGYGSYYGGPSVYVAPPPVVVERRRYWGYEENRNDYRSYRGYPQGGYNQYRQPHYELRHWHPPMMPGYRH